MSEKWTVTIEEVLCYSKTLEENDTKWQTIFLDQETLINLRQEVSGSLETSVRKKQNWLDLDKQ
jgi:hypothetical protein